MSQLVELWGKSGCGMLIVATPVREMEAFARQKNTKARAEWPGLVWEGRRRLVVFSLCHHNTSQRYVSA